MNVQSCTKAIISTIILFLWLFTSIQLCYGTSETRYFRNAITESKVYPENYNILQGTLDSGSIGDLNTSDNTYMVFNSVEVSEDNHQVEIEFNGTHTGVQPKLELKIEGKYSGAVTTQCNTLYNYDLDRYAQTGEDGYDTFKFGTTDSIRYLNVELNFSRFRSSTGEWKYKVTTIRASAFTLSLDYMHFRTFAYELGTTRTSSYVSSLDVEGLTIGIRVWKFDTDTKEMEITSGSPVATVIGPSSSTVLDADWECPETSNVENVTVRIYKSGDLLWTFVTEELNEQLDNVEWTVYYAFARVNMGTPYFPNWVTFLRFGASTYDTRIESFSHSTPSEKEWHNIASWTFTLNTRQWTDVDSWTFHLRTRQWTYITNWVFDLSRPLDFPIGPTLFRVAISVTLNGEPMDKINITITGGPSNLTFWKMTDSFGDAIVRLKMGTYLFYIRHDIYLVEHNISIFKHCQIHFELNSTEYIMVTDWTGLIMEIAGGTSCVIGICLIYAYYNQKQVSKQWKKMKSLKGKPKKEIDKKLKGKR